MAAHIITCPIDASDYCVDRTVGGYEGLIAAWQCITSNEVCDQFAVQFNVLKKLWEALQP